MSSISWICVFSFLVVTSCTIETAKPIKSHALVIASDFLHAKDTILFKDFINRHDVRIKIRHLSAEQVIRIVQDKGYNSGIDMILAQNMSTPIKLNKKNVLHDMIEPDDQIKSQNQYISYKHNFIGIGLDPFVFKYTNDSLRRVKHYKDLAEHTHYHTLSKTDQLSFISPLRKEQNRGKTYDWAKKWTLKTSLRAGTWSDSAELVLCKFSQLESFNDSIWKMYPKGHYFPDQDRKGVHFDVMTLSIVQQAEHFTDAQKFLDHYQNSGYNAKLNEALNRFPIYDYLKARNEGPKFYSVPLDQFLQYFDVLERMLKKLS